MNKDSAFICICGATPLETFWIKRGLGEPIKWKNGASLYHIGPYMGQNILLVNSGVGGKNTRRALGNLPEKLRIKLAINIGCTGALTPYLKIAHQNIPPQIRCYAKGAPQCIPPPKILEFAHLVATAFMGSRVYFLPSMTVKKAFNREDKIALHTKAPDLGCVDLESYYFAKFFSQMHIPYLIIRSVSDRWNHKLPPSTYLDPVCWKRKGPIPITQLPNILRFHLGVIRACWANQRFISGIIRRIFLLEY